MFKSKITWCAALVGVVTLSGIGIAMAQDSQPGGGGGRGGRGGGNFADMRQRMADAIKEKLGVTDDEWKALQPKIEKVMALQRDSRGMGAGGMGRLLGFGGGRGGRGGGGGGAQTYRNPDGTERQPTDVEAKQALLTETVNKKDASKDDIKAALAAYREARNKARAELEKAQKELVDVLTPSQEAFLVSIGMLE